MRRIANFMMPAGLGGCASASDLGSRPEPGAFGSARALVGTSQTWPTDSWWQDFHDPQINTLASEAPKASPTIEVAATRITGGTGSAFVVIPAQNATGNWIKAVQRLPARVQLDPTDLREHPLRVGLSMHATINLSGEH